MHGVIRLMLSTEVRLLADYWKDRKPDMLISLIPNFNRALFQAARRVMPAVPMVTILTDFADYPRISGSSAAAVSDLRYRTRLPAGAGTGAFARAGFPNVGDDFEPAILRTEPVDRKVGRAALGLDPDKPVG